MKIKKTKAGTYTTQIAIRDADGKRHVKRFTRSTRRELQEVVLEYQTVRRVYTESTAFGDCLARLIDEKEKILSPSTMRGYKNIQKTLTDKYSAFMRTPVEQVTQSLLQDLANDLRKSRKRKTVSNYMGLISDVLTNNDCRMPRIVIRPDPEKYEAAVPTAAVVRTVALASKGTRYELPFALACLGMRRGEICAATAEDLRDGNVLHVRHALATSYDGEVIRKATKTSSSDRMIPLPDDVAELLRKRGRGFDGSPAALTAGFWHFLKSVDVPPFRLHDCRHFFASYCHDVLKLSDAQIMRLGGWKTDHIMKRVYITSITDESLKVRDSLGGILS